MYKLYATFIGALIAIMVTFNGVLNNNIGNYFATLVIHLVGIFSVIIVIIIRREKFSLKKGIPVYLFSAGGIGVLLIALNNICFTKLGASLTLALGVLGQLTLATIIDHFGLFGMEVYKFKPKKLIGFAIIIAGLIVMTLY